MCVPLLTDLLSDISAAKQGMKLCVKTRMSTTQNPGSLHEQMTGTAVGKFIHLFDLTDNTHV